MKITKIIFMKKTLSLILFFIMLFNFVFAQELNSTTNNTNELQNQEVTFDTSKTTESGWLHENDGEKHYFTAIGFVAFWNILLSSYNRFVLQSDWAKVGWNEWDHFWERKLEWDRDWYWTNFVLHPYQGNLYYTASRASNLNQLESFVLTVLGSASWEYLCETNSPSKNDMVYTTVGAYCVGEMLYRLSLNADEISSILGYAIAPTRLWTQTFTRQKPLGGTRNIHELSLKFSMGNTIGRTNLKGYKGDYEEQEVYPIFMSPELYIAYNDPYGHDSNEPYSQFEFLFKGAVGKGSGTGANCSFKELDEKLFYNIRILSNGMMFSRAPNFGENIDTTIGMVMEYDFDWHSYYLLSSLAPGVAIKQRITRDNDSKIEWQAHLAAIILGTSDFYYYRRDFNPYIVEQRNGVFAPYNYNIGGQTVLKFKYQTEKGSSVDFGFRGYAMYDFYNQLQYFSNGERGTQVGWDFVGITNLSAELAVTNKVHIGISDEVYAKYATYENINDVSQFVNTISVFAKIQAK